MPNDIPPPIKYTSRVRRGFGWILNEEACRNAQARRDADLAVAWMEQEYKEQVKQDNARASNQDPLPCPSTPSTPGAGNLSPGTSSSSNPLPDSSSGSSSPSDTSTAAKPPTVE